MMRLVAGLLFAAFASVFVAAEGEASERMRTCMDLGQLFAMAEAKRESSESPPFGAPRTLRSSYLGATACNAQSESGKTIIACTLNGRDEASVLEKTRSWIEAATTCLPRWDRTVESISNSSFVSPDGSAELRFRKAPNGPAVQALVTHGACLPMDYMRDLARSGRRSEETPRFRTEAQTLPARYFEARACTGRANDSGGGYAVSCAYDATGADAVRLLLDHGRRVAETCLAGWTAATVPGGYAYRNPSNFETLTLLKRGDTSIDMTLSTHSEEVKAPFWKVFAKPATAAATAPAIPQAPAQSSCTPYNDLFLMAKIGSEGGKSAPFTTTPRTLARAYLGAQKCVGAKDGSGHKITCTTATADSAAAQRALEAQDKGMAACHDDWFRVLRKADDVFFMMPTDRASFRVETLEGTSVRTTMTYDTCRPLESMRFSVGVGQWFDATGKQTGSATPLKMKYFGGTCSAKPAQGERTARIACVFPDLEGAQARRMALEIVQTTKTCQPAWAFQDLSDSWLFEAANGFQMIVEAREGRPPGLIMQKAPSRK